MGGGCGAARGLSDENFPSNHYLMETRDRHLVARWGGKVADLKIGNGSVWNSSFWRANTELPMPGRLWWLQPRIVEATGDAGGLTAGDRMVAHSRSTCMHVRAEQYSTLLVGNPERLHRGCRRNRRSRVGRPAPYYPPGWRSRDPDHFECTIR